MANVLDVKTRDFSMDIAADDPLMELSRIMGFDKPHVPAAPEPMDPQIAIEDSFSLDLERELALEEIPAEPMVQLDDEFNAAFEDELSDAIQFGEDAPSVVPSLEDELSALLGESPKATHAMQAARTWAEPLSETQDNSWPDKDDYLAETPAQSKAAYDSAAVEPVEVESSAVASEQHDTWSEMNMDPVRAEPAHVETRHAEEYGHPDQQEVSWTDDDWELPEETSAALPGVEGQQAVADEVLLDDDWLIDSPSSEAQANVPAFGDAANPDKTDGEPWFDSDLAAQLDLAAAPGETLRQPETETGQFADPVLSQAGRPDPLAYAESIPEADESDLGAMDFDFAIEDAIPAVETPEQAMAPVAANPAPVFDTWFQSAPPAPQHPEEALNEDYHRLFAGQEPIVDSAEPLMDTVAQTDDFDIPDFDFAPEPKSAGEMTSYEPEYVGYEPAAPKPAPVTADMDFDFEALLDEQLATEAGMAPAALAGAAGAAAAMRPLASERVDADLDFHPFGDEPPAFPEAGNPPSASGRKPWIVPAALAAAVMLGGGIYYAFSGNAETTSTGGPALVKADPQPVKIAPANPGGKAVPDQDKAVYDKVDGEQAALPSQGTLVSESEEPVDIASVAGNESGDVTADAAASSKSEERVDASAGDMPAAPSAETAAVSPKKVRTFIVKPDGTLVERPAEAAAAAPVVQEASPEAPVVVAADQPVAVPAAKPKAAAPEADLPAETVAAPDADAIAKLAAAEPVAAEPAAAEPVQAAAEPEAAKPAPAVKVVKTKKIKAPAAETAAVAAPADAAPVLESRPSDQPVNIVGKTGGTKPASAAEQDVQVASADAAPAPVAGGYAIQIASTPSPEAAKSTYAALNRKFLSVIGGRGVNIQKAQVEGKGTVYRVRIPAGSKQEAAALCARYKASGGNCFVTK